MQGTARVEGLIGGLLKRIGLASFDCHPKVTVDDTASEADSPCVVAVRGYTKPR